MTIIAKIVEADANTVTAAITGLKNDTQYRISVIARSNSAASNPSNTMEIIPHPTPTPNPDPVPQAPLIGGSKTWEDDVYKYCLFYSNATTMYEAIRTKEGESVEFEVLLVGAGGAGKGQTLTMGKGGDGGGGQLVIGKLPPTYSGSIFVTVPAGGTNQSDSPANTTVKEGSTILTAIAGKNATDKNDAAGYAKQQIPESWSKLSMFTWLLPGSDYVGGVATSGEQNFPNGTFCGEGGAGTKDNKAGNGCESYVAIRWKK